ncbi:hypothetical protein FH972_012771 [Carpinus fangiana]|uniref:Uncharacterized protein n=1 Tax=Carpinus fangiana TaxID=176857 RepID=A0A5N6R868_9ROSI|nr:hypothetical protein FH972_012771 [Carpinus fangiana]
MWCSGEVCSGQCVVFGGGLKCGGYRVRLVEVWSVQMCSWCKGGKVMRKRGKMTYK